MKEMEHMNNVKTYEKQLALDEENLASMQEEKNKLK